jgi:DNA-binding HxlR family transcriptional regulator
MQKYRGYGQLCPVAKAAEVMAERWTPIIVRELLNGSCRFNELRRGIPLISPGVLSQRLRALEDAGVIARERVSGARGRSALEYRLLPAGHDLRPLIEQLGRWGQRWVSGALRREDLDPASLMWAAHRCMRVDALRRANTVIAFELFDAPAGKRRWWIVVRDGQVELCLKNLGYTVEVTVSTKVRTLAEVWLGKLGAEAAVRAGAIRLEGAPALVRTFAEWCPHSRFVDRTTLQAPGRQR